MNRVLIRSSSVLASVATGHGETSRGDPGRRTIKRARDKAASPAVHVDERSRFLSC